MHIGRIMTYEISNASANNCNDKSDKKKSKGEEAKKAEFMANRLALIQSFYRAADFLFEAIYSGQTINTSQLAPMLSEKKR